MSMFTAACSLPGLARFCHTYVCMQAIQAVMIMSERLYFEIHNCSCIAAWVFSILKLQVLARHMQTHIGQDVVQVAGVPDVLRGF